MKNITFIFILFIILCTGEIFSQKKVPTEMVVVEGGTFMMGSDEGMNNERPVHSVTVSSYLIGKYQVTQELWQYVMEDNPSYFKGKRRPVEKVTWYDAVEFCNILSEMEGLEKAYSGAGKNIKCNFNSNGYRLPTEAEWDFAARGGNKSKGYKYSGGHTANSFAWYFDNAGEQTHDVGKKKPNELGLYDMSGNVWEWCWDWHNDYSYNAQIDPKGPASGEEKVMRGSSWIGDKERCRIASRAYELPTTAFGYIGFRLARSK